VSCRFLVTGFLDRDDDLARPVFRRAGRSRKILLAGAHDEIGDDVGAGYASVVWTAWTTSV
jgi:hypothetical protein